MKYSIKLGSFSINTIGLKSNLFRPHHNALLLCLLIIMLVISTSCNSKSSEDETKTTNENAKSADNVTESNSDSDASSPVEGTAVTTKLWSITYPKDWIYDEENTTDNDNCSSGYFHLDENSDTLAEVQIEVSIESTDSYRNSLKRSEVNIYEMVEQNKGDFVEFGGVNFIHLQDTDYDRIIYLSRVENSSATVNVMVSGEYDNPKVTQLLDTLQFTLEDIGNSDPPWPWNGTPLTPEASYSAMIGSYKINTQWLPFEESLLVDDIFSGEIVANDEKLWTLCDNKLYEFSMGDKLSLIKESSLDNNYEKISIDKQGNLYLTGFMSPMLTLLNNEVIATNKDVDLTVMHPGGEWGISFFYDSPSKKITLKDNIASMSEWAATNDLNVNTVSISDNHIFVAGIDKETENHGVWVYDTSGNLKCVLGNKEFDEPDCLGSITQVLETTNGFIGLDGNMREIFFWKSDGTYIGNLDASELFGTNYPWISAGIALKDGSVLIGMTEEREDESADEFIVFRLTGF